MMVAGWGKATNAIITKNNYRQFGAAVRKLQKLKLPVQDSVKCTDWLGYKNPDFNPKIQMCAGGQKGILMQYEGSPCILPRVHALGKIEAWP